VPAFFRKRRNIGVPITLSVVLISMNVVLMVGWIIIFARFQSWSGLTIGTVIFSLILVGISFYMVLIIKEFRLNQRQANFIDSVTHELKTPIATLRLYLDTLQMRTLNDEQRGESYAIMNKELLRLDLLISQLLEVGRLDAIGQETEPERVELLDLLRRGAERAAAHHERILDETFEFHGEPVFVFARKLVLELLFGNLLDNAVKYGGDPPQVTVTVRTTEKGRIRVEIADNGEGVPPEFRKKIFTLFYRGGSELERRRKGTGLGLYIVRTLVHSLKGSVTVHDRTDPAGCVFQVELPAPSGQA
jgi:two-component system, OmpR family, phosphate regulon sensor histidine kinase PhoR